MSDDFNRQLRDIFQFQPADLLANRRGQFSRRQEALLRAGSAVTRMSMAMFVVVMLSVVGVVGLSMWQTIGAAAFADPDARISLGIVAAVVVVVIVIGWLLSRKYMRTAGSRQISVANGIAAVASDDTANYRAKIKIGRTSLRVSTEEQLRVFQPGTAYRVFYLAGPMPIILSAEVAGSEVSGADALAAPETDESIAQDGQIQTIKRGYLIVALIGGLALVIPIVGILATNLPAGASRLVWVVMLVVACGFVPFALWWLRGRQRDKE